MNTTTSLHHSTKRSTNVYHTAALVEKARSMDMNLSATLDELLAQAIEAKHSEREKDKLDMQAMNAFITKAGMLSDDDLLGVRNATAIPRLPQSICQNKPWPYNMTIQHYCFDDLTKQVTINNEGYYVFTPSLTFLDVNKIRETDFIFNVSPSRNENYFHS